MENPDYSKEYLLAELNNLYGHASWLINQVSVLERLALISSGVVWAWVAAHDWNPLYGVVIWIPTVIICLLYIKVFFTASSLKRVHAYFEDVEKSFNLEELGWQNWKQNRKKKYLTIWAGIYWIILFLTNTAIALFFPFSKLSS